MRLSPLLTAVVSTIIFTGCASAEPKAQTQTKPEYDAALAEELGADPYGMRSYVFVMLKTGPAEITDEKKRGELFAGHFANMGRLADEGKLVMAGPFIEGGDKRGLFVFNAASVDEAKEFVSGDPAVNAGIFVAEYTKFYGSAALIKLSEIHAKIQKEEM